MANEKTSLTDIIKENSPLLSAMGIFAALATYFQGNVNTSVHIEESWVNDIYFFLSFLSFFIFLLISYEFLIHSLLIANKTRLLDFFGTILLLFILSVVLLFLIIYKEAIIVFLPITVTIFGLLATIEVSTAIFRRLLQTYTKNTKVNPTVVKAAHGAVILLSCFLFYRWISKPITNMLVELINSIPK